MLSKKKFSDFIEKAKNLHETEPIDEVKFLQEILQQKSLSPEQKIICNLQLAYGFLVLSRVKESDLLYRKMLQETLTINNKELYADALEGVGNVCIDTGHLDEGKKKLKEAIGIYQNLKLAEKESKASNTLAVLYYQKSEYEKAIHWYNRSLDLTENKESARYVNALGNSGLIYHSRGDMAKAIEVYEQAVAISKKNDYYFARMIFQENLGDSYREMGKFEKAKENFEEALHFAVEHNDEKHIGTISSDFANYWVELGQFETAFTYLKSALKNLKKVNYPFGLIDVYYSSAKYWLAKGQILDSKKDLEKALKITNENQVLEYKCDVLTLLAEIHESLGDLNKSYEYLMEADNLARERESEFEHANVLLQRARININHNNFNEAIMFLNEVLWISKKTQDICMISDASLLFAQIYLTQYHQNNKKYVFFEKANDYLKQTLKMTKEKQLLPRYLKALVIEGVLLSSQNQHDQANQSLRKAKEIAEKIGMHTKMREIQERLSFIEQSSAYPKISPQQQRFTLSIALEDLRKVTSSFIKNILTKKDVEETFIVTYKIHEKTGTMINAVDNLDINDPQWYNIVMQMGLLYTINFGQGHKYHKGFFGPFPFGETFLRAIVYTTQLKDTTQISERNEGNIFVIICYVFPKRMSPLLYDRDKLETIFFKEFESVNDVSQLGAIFLKKARFNIFESLTQDLKESIEDHQKF
ncbi:hypothetical protein NEF87_002075 [Candidatus Lokiarchaeum ossiferum]|uniref:MalT-like TPR region domain-containing protein n=1 Tax=Candidatus Lokiarchaeum ossiferum TaxID=2951803 RepID=A0ABY6HQL4_9ARCH|nr:hypothetical protein NEF87_002075 [Candidatus Lokiarchaeum sp. B-35]